MRFQGALIKEQGITFAVVIVKKHVIDNRAEADDCIRSLASVFVGYPVVLMAQNYKGAPTYYGRRDIAKFLSHVPVNGITWREYTLN